MSKTNAAWIVFFCLSFIGIFMWAFDDMGKEIENSYQVKLEKLNHQVDSLKWVCDSTKDETFRMEIDLGRYEVAFTIFAERNPKAAEQYAKIISEETE